MPFNVGIVQLCRRSDTRIDKRRGSLSGVANQVVILFRVTGDDPQFAAIDVQLVVTGDFPRRRADWRADC